MSNYTIYMHLNNINGKVYIGQTGRKNLHERYGKDGVNNYFGFECPNGYHKGRCKTIAKNTL